MTEQAYPDALPPQYRLHWYVLERVLGQGGFGITYLARDTNLDQPVAIKEYLPVEFATRRPDATIRSRTDDQRERFRWGLERFIQEARTLARFDHPSIVRVHSIFEFNNTAYMVMRFEQGENLAARLEGRGTLAEAELLGIMLPILDGLALVHQAGFIHRDIKPDNIHIRNDGTPVLLDFGSARNAVGKAHTVTILVAPGYAPFEQYYSDSGSQGPWTDIYGLGATCYRAIAGRAPIDAIARSKGILGSTRDVLVPAAVIGAGRYSGKLLAAIDHALAFAEKDRPQTLAEWRQELVGDRRPEVAPTVLVERPSRRDEPRAVAPRPPIPTAVPRESTRLPATAPPDPEPRGVGRSMWSAAGWGIAGAALAAIAIGVYLRVHRPDQTPAAAPLPVQVDKQIVEEQQKAVAAAEAERKRRKDEQERMEAAQREEELKRKRQEEEARRQAELERKRLEEERIRLAEAKRKAELERKQKEPARPPPIAPSPKAVKEEPPVLVATPPAPPPAPAAQPPPPPTPAQQLASADRAIARGSYAEAAEILKPLAEQGTARAQTALADLYAAGRGVAKDEAEARAWYQKAATQGHGDAQTRLGDLHANGRGGPQSSFQAYVWYGAAARSGNAAARDKQARVATVLQPAEIQQADRVIDNLARPPKGQ